MREDARNLLVGVPWMADAEVDEEALRAARAAEEAAVEAERAGNRIVAWRSYMTAGLAYAKAAQSAPPAAASGLWKQASAMYEKAQGNLPPSLPLSHPAHRDV